LNATISNRTSLFIIAVLTQITRRSDPNPI
jgi:hypothetical protein